MDHLYDLWHALRANVRGWDLIDILLVSVPMYAVLVLLKSRASRAAPLGLLAVLLVYLIAHWLDMVLTSIVLRFGATVMAFGLLVIFQDDVRRFFQRAGSLLTWRAGSAPDEAIDGILVEALSTMAERRMGALVVLPGREPLAPHVEGGHDLDGKATVPALLSLFDPSTPGHDGAVVLSDQRIARFSVHLPLSHNLGQLAGVGTRHTAALGLAERCDALVLVVSEERGSISAARNGKLARDLDLSSLTALLSDFLGHRVKRSVAVRRRLQRALLARPLMKLTALVLAATLWFVVAYKVDVVQRTFGVPLEFRNVPSTLSVDRFSPQSVQVTLSGSVRDFETLDEESMVISLDIADAGAGWERVKLAEDDLRRPDALTVVSIKPGVAKIRLKELVE